MDNELSRVIGQRINDRLAATGKKQKELAEVLGVPDNTISYFCSGRRMPNTSQIRHIANYLDCSADYLLGITDTATTDKDIRFICENTGFTETALENIINYPRITDLLNFFFSEKPFNEKAMYVDDFCFSLEHYRANLKCYIKEYSKNHGFVIVTTANNVDLCSYRSEKAARKLIDEYVKAQLDELERLKVADRGDLHGNDQETE